MFIVYKSFGLIMLILKENQQDLSIGGLFCAMYGLHCHLV